MTKVSDSKGKTLAAAARLFRQQGYHGTALHDILAASGSPRGSLYFHFPKGKEEIGEAALTLAGEAVRQAIAQAAETSANAEIFLTRIARGMASGIEPELSVAIDVMFPMTALTRAAAASADPVTIQTPRGVFDYVIEQGRRDYDVQRYKGLGEMTSSQLWETTMDPDRRTLLSVKLEDIAETEQIFSTLMGEDVESRRKFIEDNALDVKNLDI